ETEGDDRLPAVGLAQLGVSGQVADDGDGSGHWIAPSRALSHVRFGWYHIHGHILHVHELFIAFLTLTGQEQHLFECSRLTVLKSLFHSLQEPSLVVSHCHLLIHLLSTSAHSSYFVSLRYVLT